MQNWRKVVITSNQFRPDKCERCYSNRIVPIIEGHPVGKSWILTLQKKIELCGSFAISNGSAIWACADCGGYITDDAYRMDESNRKLIEAYNDAVDNAFNSFEMIDEVEERKLMGLDFLCTLSRNFLSNEFFEIEMEEDSFLIKNFDGSKLEFDNSKFELDEMDFKFDLNSLLTNDRFCQIDEYLGEEKTKEFSIRINKEECVAVATRVAPGRIQVKRK